MGRVASGSPLMSLMILKRSGSSVITGLVLRCTGLYFFFVDKFMSAVGALSLLLSCNDDVIIVGVSDAGSACSAVLGIVEGAWRALVVMVMGPPLNSVRVSSVLVFGNWTSRGSNFV